MNANPASSRPGYPALRLEAASLALLLLACGGKEESRPGPAPADSSVLRSPASSALSQQSVVELARGVIVDTLEVPVRIVPDERRTTQVIAPAEGRIEAVFVRTPDQAVRAGERLALLYSQELVTAQREYLLLDPDRDGDMARQTEERLLRMGLTRSQLRAIRSAKKPLERLPITSPKNGYLLLPSLSAGAAKPAEAPAGASGMGGGMGGMSGGVTSDGSSPGGMSAGMEAGQSQSALRVGTSVTRGTMLAQVNDLALVSAVLTVPVRSVSLLRKGDSVHLSLQDAGFAGMAAIDFLESRVADTSGNVEVRTYLPNPGFLLKLGSLGKAHISPIPETTWILPRTAIHDLGERRLAWVRDSADSGVFQAQEIRVGRIGARQVEVLEGLAPGSIVAENASLLLDPDVVVEPLPIREASPSASHSQHQVEESEPQHRDDSGNMSSAGHPEGHGSPSSGRDGQKGTGTKPEHSEHASTANTLTLTKEQARLAGIQTTVAREGHVAPSQVFRAVTQFDSRSREDIPARTEGRVEQVRVLRVGERIEKGQVLATLQSEPLLAAQEEFLAARKATAALANPELVRAQVSAGRRRLHVLGMTDLQVSELIKRGKAFPRQPIQSPRDGILIEVRVQPGQYVAAGTPLFTVGLADRIWVETWMLATEVARFPEGTEASVRIEGVTGEEIRGRLDHVRQGTTLSGSVTLAHIGIPNLDNRILPGMQAWVTFRQGGKHVLSVPHSALLRSSSSTMVWVQVAENAFAPRMVKMGVESLDAVEILEGIRAGEEIVVEGAYLLNSEWTIRQGAGKIHAGH